MTENELPKPAYPPGGERRRRQQRCPRWTGFGVVHACKDTKGNPGLQDPSKATGQDVHAAAPPGIR
jgi:hypothetical protein